MMRKSLIQNEKRYEKIASIDETSRIEIEEIFKTFDGDFRKRKRRDVHPTESLHPSGKFNVKSNMSNDAHGTKQRVSFNGSMHKLHIKQFVAKQILKYGNAKGLGRKKALVGTNDHDIIEEGVLVQKSDSTQNGVTSRDARARIVRERKRIRRGVSEGSGLDGMPDDGTYDDEWWEDYWEEMGDYADELVDDYVDWGEFSYDDYGFGDVEDDFEFELLMEASQTEDYSDLVEVLKPTKEDLDKYGHQAEDFILQCSFDKQNCSHK